MHLERTAFPVSRRPGFTLIELLICLAIMVSLVGLLLPAVQQARAAARRISCFNNLKQIGIALHARHDSRQSFPAGRGTPAPKIFSPHAALLPYLEQAAAQSLIDFDAPPADYTAGPIVYDGSRNLPAARLRLPLFHCPAASPQYVEGSIYGSTGYAANAGSGSNAGSLIDADGVFHLGSAIKLRDILDGSTHTAAFSERMLGDGAARLASEMGRSELTMREIPLAVDPSSINCLASASGNWNHERGAKWIVGNYGNSLYNHALAPNSTEWDCLNMSQQKARMSARSRHVGGVGVLFCDGHVQFVDNTIALSTWREFATRAESARR